MNDRFENRFGGSPLPHLLDKALKNTQKELQKAKQEGETDSLTGLLNRRALDKQLSEVIKRLSYEGHRREADPDYVLFFLSDVDRFKFLNDRYGHSKGDEALKIVAKRFEEEANERGGRAIRFGGDEFALIQEGKGNLTDDQLQAISSRIQEKINSDLYILVSNGKFDITVSIGCAVLRKDRSKNEKTSEEIAQLLIQEADARMYAFKSVNRIEKGK